VQALNEVTFDVAPGSITAIIGANGAGKSTLMNCLARLHRVWRGSIAFQGASIERRRAHQVVRKGLVLVPEGRFVAAPLTVQENLTLSRYAKRGHFTEGLEMVFELFPRLAERRKQVAGLLSGGEQQMLAISRALLTQPELLLLDEPAMGLSHGVTDVVYESLVKIHAQGISIVLVEQNAERALAVADRALIMQRGSIVAQGGADEIRGTQEFEHAYLG
jgi:branched-chain amino acid transport system ATP-binding protein